MNTITKKVLSPADFLLIEQNESHILFHAPTLQMYNIDNKNVLDCIKFCLNSDQTVGHYSEDELLMFKKKITKFLKKSSQKSPSITVRPSKDSLTAVKHAVLPISAKCNLACPYCFARIDGEFNFGDYSEKEIEDTVDFLYNQPYKEDNTRIVFFGGEPFLNFPMLEHGVNYIKKKYPNFNVSFSATTNGTILDEKKIDFLAENKISLMISLDGPKNDFNLRRYKNGKHSVDKVIENIQKIASAGISVQLRATVTNEHPDIVGVYDFFEKMKQPFYIVFAYKSGNKDHAFSDYKQENIDSLGKQMDAINIYYLNKIKNRESVHCLSILSKLSTLRYKRILGLNCSGGRNMFSIISDGSIFTCEHLANDKKYAVGDIKTGWNKSKLEQMSSVELKEVKECHQCIVRNLCIGGCFSEKVLCGRKTWDKLEDDTCNLRKLEWEKMIVLFSEIKTHYPNFYRTLEHNKK